MEPFIICICPTYKRPEYLANAVACFVNQTYPTARRHLVICDDAVQHDAQAGDAEQAWSLFTSAVRLPNLPTKFNALVGFALAQGLRPDLIAVWEDDDLYLPWHLTALAKAYQQGPDYLTQARIWSTYREPRGKVHEGKPGFLFHASWAFSADLFARVGGYPIGERLEFDQKMGALLRKHGKHGLVEQPTPSYVYRWGGVPYHGSQASGDRYLEHWKALEKRPAPWVGKLQPRFDDEARLLFKLIAGIAQ